MRLTAMLALAAGTLLTGCWFASEPRGTELLIDTTPPGATCLVSQVGRPAATVAPTPAIAMLDRHPGALDIVCRRNGFADTALSVPASSTEPDNTIRVELALVPLPAP